MTLTEAEKNDKWMRFGNVKKNWQSDYKFENGNYQCYCIKCKSQFMGNKRRLICRECFEQNSEG